jgi:hypothetical protein
MANQFPTTGTMDGDIKAGYITNGVYNPNPTVQPTQNPTSLQGTMTGQQAQQPVVIPPQVQQQSSPMALFQAMNAMQSQTKANNALMTQRNLLLKQLYDTPLTSEELNQLDPTMKQAVQSNNRDQIDISLRLISDQVQGRTATIDNSMQFLTTQYMNSIEKAEQQKQQSLETVLSYSKSLGAKPSEIASALGYGGTYDWTKLDNMMVSAPEKLDTQVIDVGGNKVLIDTQTGKTIKNYGGAEPTISPISPTGVETQTPTITGKPRNDTQNTALGYAQRMQDADSVITSLGDKFVGVGSYIGGILPNVMKSSDRQQFEQAQRNFINSVLRKESGAAISPTEFDSAAKQYFPQPGDSAGVLAQKSANRQRVINSFLQSSNTAPTSSGTYEDYLNAIK